MSDHIVKEIKPKLEEISQFMKLKRKKIKDSIISSLVGFEKDYASALLVKSTYENDIKTLRKTKSDLNTTISTLKNKNIQIDKDIIKKRKEYELLSSTHKEILTKFELLENKHKEIWTKHNLVSKILSAKNTENEGVERFKHLFETDFMIFANKESSLAEEAKAVLILQGIEKSLEMITGFSEIYSKNIIAIGGGFSGGKSAFVSSFFKENTIKLPIGIKPVTAIPTYIVSGARNIIKGYSQSGGIVDIDIDLYKRLSHDFVKSFNFNLKDIMPVMAIETPIDIYNYICFVDTPGYNPAVSDGFTAEDKKTAIEYLEQANSLIWMIGLDSNGTIPASDLDFLSELNLVDKKLFIVANKADLRAESDLEDILNEIEESLDDYDIEFSGISAYSSNTKREYMYRKISLYDFLKSENNPVEVQQKILKDIRSVIAMYSNAITSEIKKSKKMSSNLKSLELDLLESGYDSYNEKFSNRLDDMKKVLDTKIMKNELKTIKKIGNSMEYIVKEIFKNL